MKKFISFTFLVIIFDRLLKILVENFLTNDKIYVIKNFFYLTYTRNEGAAFSIFYGGRLLFIFFALLAIILICYYVKKSNLYKIKYALLLGGIIGNLIDRVLYGYVIDFIGLIIFKYNFPIFNLADMMIVISAFLIILTSNKDAGGKNEIISKR